MTGKKTKLVIVHRYFWPQNLPYAQMLKHIAIGASQGGFEVDVLTTKGGVEDSLDRSDFISSTGISVHAIRASNGRDVSILKKALDAMFFGAWVFFKLLWVRPDMVMVATTPPVVMGLVVRWAASLIGFKYIYHCQDIHPEAMRLNNSLKSSFLYRFMSAIDKRNVNMARCVIVLSEDMKKTMLKRGCAEDNIRIVNNFVYDVAPVLEKEPDLDRGIIRFLFAGTLGLFQNLELLLDAITYFKGRSDVEFVFMGGGVCRLSLERRAYVSQLENVLFVGQKPVEDALLAMRGSDFGIISIAPKISEVAYPSKTMMYLSNGLPVFAVVDRDTEIYRFINAEQLGVAVASDSASEIAEALERAMQLHTKNTFSRHHIAKVAENKFGMSIVVDKFVKIFSECKGLKQ